MAPLVSLLALFAFALFTTTAASPHVARHVHNHVHRPRPRVHIDPAPPLRKRSLNRRCSPQHTNATSALPSTAPVSVAPLPSQPSSAPGTPSSASSTSSYVVPTSPSPQTTSQAPSPTTTSAAPPPPTTSSTPPPPATTSSSAPPAQTSSSSSDSGEPSFMYGTQSGQGTWFDVGLGACGITNNNNQNIVAVSEDIFDNYPGYDGTNPNTNPVCNKGITISYGGVSVGVIVVDRCVGCAELDLDMAPSAFSALANVNVGRIDITWQWT